MHRQCKIVVIACLHVACVNEFAGLSVPGGAHYSL